MKKTIFVLLAAVSISITVVSAQTYLAPLGTDNYTILLENDVTLSQTTTNLTLTTPQNLGGIFGGGFASVYDWSTYSDTNVWTFGLYMSAPGASPGIGFTVEFFNAALDTIVNAYQGGAAGLTTEPTFVPINLSLAGSGDLSSIGGMQFTWDGSGAGTVVIESVGVVPEPTTWAMLLFGAALFGGLALRRRLSAVRR